jgi:hypothetical protein
MERQISKLQIEIIVYDDEFIIRNLNELHYHDRVVIQGLLWIEGESLHNDIDNECCPDFSCCELELFEKDKEERKRIYNNTLDRME